MITIDRIAASGMANDYQIKKVSLFGSYADGATNETRANMETILE